MKELFITQAAYADLMEIWAYLFEHSSQMADRIVDEITDKYDLLCISPLIGRDRSELGANYRSLSIGNYIIFYRVLETKLEISRILHGSRDTSTLFIPEDED